MEGYGRGDLYEASLNMAIGGIATGIFGALLFVDMSTGTSTYMDYSRRR